MNREFNLYFISNDDFNKLKLFKNKCFIEKDWAFFLNICQYLKLSILENDDEVIENIEIYEYNTLRKGLIIDILNLNLNSMYEGKNPEYLDSVFKFYFYFIVCKNAFWVYMPKISFDQELNKILTPYVLGWIDKSNPIYDFDEIFGGLNEVFLFDERSCIIDFIESNEIGAEYSSFFNAKIEQFEKVIIELVN